MRTPLICCLATALGIVVPATVLATPDIGEHDNGFSKLDERALAVYEDCWKALGAQCGRNIVDDGVADGTEPSDARVQEWTATMERWLSPPEPEPTAIASSGTSVASAPATTSVAPASGGGCPSSMYAESGSAGYSAYNPSSGATGCYQVIPSTADAYGCDLSTPTGQDACAAAICEDVGASAWAASGANPC